MSAPPCIPNKCSALLCPEKKGRSAPILLLQFDIIENIIKRMKAIATVEDVQGEIINVDEFIESLDKEMSEISTQVEQSVEMAERHLVERIENGEQETESHISSSNKAKSRASYIESNMLASESKEKLIQLENE